MCTCLAEERSPDLIIASCNGFANNSLWVAAWATTMPFHVVGTDDRAKCGRLRRFSASVTMFLNLYNTLSRDLSLTTLVCRVGNSFL